MSSKNKGFKWLTTVSMLSALLIVSACGGNNNSSNGNGSAQPSPGSTAGTTDKAPYTITYLTSQSRMQNAMKDMAEALKKDENITVNFEVVPDNQFQTLLLTKIASGEVPDVVDINAPETFPVYNALENFEDLSAEPWVARLNNSDQYKYTDDKYYAYPTTAPGLVAGAYYNKQVFSSLGLAVPNTYAEYMAVLDKIKGAGITPIYMSNKDTWTTQIPMLVNFGAALGDNANETYTDLIQNKKKFADVPEFKQALTDFQLLVKNGYVNKDHVTATYDMSQQMLVEGKAAMVVSGNFLLTDIMNKWPQADIGFFAIPYNDTDKVISASIFTGIAVMKNGKQVEKAKKWLNLWTQPKYQDINFKINPGLPAMKDVDGGELHPEIQAAYDKYLKTGKVIYQLNDFFAPAGGFLDSKLWPIYVEVAMGKSVDSAIKDIDKELQQFGKIKKIPGFE
ncbi:ABC transporter substrate-binding protein [Cohnella abietis]|uniref:Multiple sugar-binding protein n=1 Tax=Cohnella abietis TaxID=2507935 RepID=A0A3T1DBQ6_9BACL|nr:extracellular solute-binding protein [Cohnella abietis]BBI35527.1 multiple sugar-binding protein [Cohnella abietis]